MPRGATVMPVQRRHAIRAESTLIDGSFRPATIFIDEHGLIEAVSSYGEPLGEIPVEHVVDRLIAGLVDTHVHINEPGRTLWEGFATATRAAAAGGVTSLVDMPLNCIPVTTTLDALKVKLEAIGEQLSVDVGFWGGVVPGNAAELSRLAGHGILGAKCFLCPSGIDDFPHSTISDLRLAMPIMRDLGLPLLVHAELESEAAPACSGDVRRYQTYLDSRPRSWEDLAITMMIGLCRETRCAVHIVHLSSASALPLIRAAKDEGLPFTVETCPHYLCLSAEEVPDGATEFKCAPPIRESVNRDGLWRGLADGTIDFVTSDHSPCTPGLKKPLEGDFCGAWGGIASLQLGLPAIWSEAQLRGFSLEQVVELLTSKPARLAGLHTRKGQIARGFDADLCAFDPDAVTTVTPETLRFRNKVSPYLGRDLNGAVQKTWLRGLPVFEAGVQTDLSGRGRPLLTQRC